MLKPTETSKKKIKLLKKNLQKLQVFGKNAKISNFWNEMQKSQGFGWFFVASDLIIKYQRYITCKVYNQVIF